MNSRRRNSSDDEENEEIMRANGQLARNKIIKAEEDSKRTAENWKGIGNRHMAQQEYEEAYKAYSTALSISPLGPSSHIYLSNRAASLLSLKRYSAASVDARRAITLAPTFGKAHARLGQSLYFLKDYAGAVAAYENAYQFEPDNQVTWTYLNKARKKFKRENEKKRKSEEEEEEKRRRSHNGTKSSLDYSSNDDGVSVTDSENLANMAFSVVGDHVSPKDQYVSVLSTTEEGDDIDQLIGAVDRGETSIVRGKLQAALDSSKSPSFSRLSKQQEYNNHHQHEPLRNLYHIHDELDSTNNGDYDDIDDPDFDEALRLQELATIKLLNKEYKSAVEEFSAALFLVPDDTNLTPQLYIGRAYALNGLQRHEGALNDSMMAMGRNPELPEVHIVLARTYFYLKNYGGAVSAFENAKSMLKERNLGDQMSPLDELYYEKAIENKNSQEAELDMNNDEKSYRSLVGSSEKPIPKLKAPRFVSRQELLNKPSHVPPMSKALASHIPSLHTPETLCVGEERTVVILSETLGITLNRGQDGVVRVLNVAPDTPNAKHTRRGTINVGDVIREAAGIDLRRPLTNIMWSDTVALMKIAARPLHIKVAKELSERPPAIQEEIIKATSKSPRARPDPPRGYDPPSRASGMESVKSAMSENKKALFEYFPTKGDLNVPFPVSNENVSLQSEELQIQCEEDAGALVEKNENDESDGANSVEHVVKEFSLSTELDNKDIGDEDNSLSFNLGTDADKDNSIDDDLVEETSNQNNIVDAKSADKSSSDRLEILKTFLHKDFVFLPVNSTPPSNDMTKYTNTQWLAESSSRSIVVCGDVYILEKGRYFWQNTQFVPRTLALYNDLLIIGRDPKNASEIRSGLSDPSQADIFGGVPDQELMQSFLIAESVVDLMTCKLRRSCLTTPSSIEDVNIGEGTSQFDQDIRQKCFEIVAPSQNFFISAVDANVESDRIVSDNRALFLTSQWEESIKDTLYAIHLELQQSVQSDKSWIHQIILGTLHSHIVTGNYDVLERAIAGKGTQKSPYPGIDIVDEDGLTALHYACLSRSNQAVTALLNAGADCSKPTVQGRRTPCHISAEKLDAINLSTILSQTEPSRADANALDEDGLTPMSVAVLKGRGPGGNRSPSSLNICISSLQAWGGYLHVPYSPHPIHTLSAEWCHEELEMIFPLCDCEYPVAGNGMDGYLQSLGALFDYPLHMCLSTLRMKIAKISNSKRMFPVQTCSDRPTMVDLLQRTLECLLNRGFEPNERIEQVNKGTVPLNELIGFTPLQILGAAALDLRHRVKDELQCDENHPDVHTAAALISLSAELLVSKGARMSIDPPPIQRYDDEKKSSALEGERVLRMIDRSSLNLERNKDIMKTLDSKMTLHICKGNWQKANAVKGSGQTDFLPGKGNSIKVDNSNVPSGSDERNCSICWRNFGSILHRKRVCRASRRYVCEECSSNTVLIDGNPCRVSDGQFNLAKCRLERKKKQDQIDFAQKKKERKMQLEQAWMKSHNLKDNRLLQETRKDESAAKDELFFGNVGKAMKNFFMEEVTVEAEVSQASATNGKVSGIMSTLGQTGQAFRERGEKLNTMVEKTDALRNASEDFARMARELKESQQKGFFW